MGGMENESTKSNSPEDAFAAYAEKRRTISDAELLEAGAQYIIEHTADGGTEKKLEISEMDPKVVEDIRHRMEKFLEREKTLSVENHYLPRLTGKVSGYHKGIHGDDRFERIGFKDVPSYDIPSHIPGYDGDSAACCMLEVEGERQEVFDAFLKNHKELASEQFILHPGDDGPSWLYDKGTIRRVKIDEVAVGEAVEEE